MINNIEIKVKSVKPIEIHINKLWYLSQIKIFNMMSEADLMLINKMANMKTF